jgi:Fibronectin type III domain
MKKLSWVAMVAAASVHAGAARAGQYTCDENLLENDGVCVIAPDVGPAAQVPTSTTITLAWLTYSGGAEIDPNYGRVELVTPDTLTIRRDGKDIATLAGNAPGKYVDTGLKPSTLYHYAVCANFQAYGTYCSPWDASTPGTSATPKVPGVTNLKVTLRWYNQISLSWLNPPIPSADPVVSNKISWAKKSTPSALSSKSLPADPNLNQFVPITGLDAMTPYVISVCAVGQRGDNTCTTIEVSTEAPPPAPMPGPVKPAHVAATRMSPSIVIVRWDANSNDVHVVQRRLVSVGPHKTKFDTGHYFGEWITVLPKSPKPTHVFSEIVNAPEGSAYFEYRVCGVFSSTAKEACSDVVQVATATKGLARPPLSVPPPIR